MRKNYLLVCFLLIVVAEQNLPNRVRAEIPPAAKDPVNFHQQIAPILQKSCVRCHTGAEAKGGFKLETRDQLLAGGDSGAAVEPGKSGQSLLVELVSGLHEDRIMPAQGARLTAAQIGLLRGWIDQGVPWDEGFRFGLTPIAELPPRNPPLPPLAEGNNAASPIDRLLAPYYQTHDFTPGESVEDRRFARRVYLDLIGLLPPADELRAFVSSTEPDKRAKLIDKLLDDRRNYTEHWLTFWNDALRNAYIGTGYIDGGRKQITPWLYQTLYDNVPYDQMVRELVSPVPGSEGFIGGIIWRGTVNASQKREMQAAQNIGQVFLGTNLKCASCHDSFVNHWKLTDAYGLAAVFAEGPLEVHRCNQPTGEMAQVHFIFPQLGEIDATASRAQRMEQLAKILTLPENGRLARTMVNRLWAELLGRGIVEPVDDMDQKPWNQDLLDYLAYDFQEHGYDLKRTLRLICNSRAYGLSAVGAPRPDETEFIFRGPIVKRMSAEQFTDSVATLTGVWPNSPAVQLPDPKPEEAPPGDPSIAQWIWKEAKSAQADAGGRVFFRHVFELPARASDARLMITCDNECTLHINGRKVASSEQWSRPISLNVADKLVPGKNLIAIEAINYPDPVTKKGLQFQGANPAGLVAYAWIRTAGEERSVVELGSGKGWKWSAEEVGNWQRIDFDDSAWSEAAELGDVNMAPWRIAQTWQATWKDVRGNVTGKIRASLLNDDPLTRALGRPNREQVVTRRESVATTLQALELTNGETLDKLLKQGAQIWLAQGHESPAALIEAVYGTSLGRPPTVAEKSAALELVGDKLTAEGIADLLWVVVMLPDFQLVQ